MSASMKKQCPNCHGWYSNLKGFKHHLRHCRRSIDTKSSEEVHRLIANPTLSIRSSSDVFAPNKSVLSDEDISYNNGDLIQTVDSYEDNNEDDSGFRPLRRKTMAVTKFQVMLNDLLLKHKASLLLYNEIIVLVSSYKSSPSFNKLDKFKSRRSLLLSTEKSLNTSCLRPVNGTVRLHNDSLVTVPIFDAKHMITSLLTDPSLMKESNFAEGYNVLTGEVLNDHPENKKYSEIHTGDAWCPASYKRLPMGIAGSPDIFQAEMMKLMESLEYVRAYIDDLLCISRESFDDHLDKLEEVLKRLRDAGLKVNADKSTFCALEIEYC